MSSVQVIYTLGKGLSSALIAGYTGGPWSHCGLVDGDEVIESLALRGGVVRTGLYHVVDRSAAYEIVTLDCPRPDLAIEWARSTLGAPYDWTGVFGLPFMARDWQAPGRWYCSEHVEAALQRAGLDRWRLGRLAGIDPNMSYFHK
jgi:uncharacterized protein YycO